ncbi:hypothetical protein glysoja_025012 [Glycine soja]|uniref:Uncharacterized protein n=1 Tax=Glycine soja TaxID=3848 RepID=A0A0B2PXY3_GLYSO|nr:hypothetical protein glysoja_025012 [Glycine soja]
MACCFTPSTCTHGQGPFSRKLIASLEILFGLVIFTPEKLVTAPVVQPFSSFVGALCIRVINGLVSLELDFCETILKYSLLSSLKQHLPTIFPNKAWVLNYGSKINFWNNAWCMAAPIVESLGIPLRIRSLLSSSVMDFRTLNQWNIPQLLLPVQMF